MESPPQESLQEWRLRGTNKALLTALLLLPIIPQPLPPAVASAPVGVRLPQGTPPRHSPAQPWVLPAQERGPPCPAAPQARLLSEAFNQGRLQSARAPV